MSLLGIDVGTSGAKVILLSPGGEIQANITEEYPLSSPQPQWSEQHPEDWWQATCRATGKALTQAGIRASEVSGIGLSGQMVGLVTLDREGDVIRPCIMWNDQRSAKVAEELTERIGRATILRETSNPLFATFVAPKVVWMRHHEPAEYARIRHILMPKDYIAYRLTGHIGTEVSDASGTCLFNVRDRRWSKAMLGAMQIPEEWLPPCTESDEVIGTVTARAAEDSGLAQRVPVIAGAGDQPAQALGNGIVRAGLSSVTIGTSGVIFAQGDRHIEHPQGLLHSFCHSVRGAWYLMGVMLSAGGSFRWLRDLLGELAPISYDAMAERAASAPPGCEGLIFLPYLTGERCPYDDPQARGSFVGLTSRHNLGHLIRAVMEGITFGLRDSLQLMRQLGMRIDRIAASGGAVRSALWLQMLADVFGTEIVTTHVTEGAAYGAAMLAGIGTGRYVDAGEAADALIRLKGIAEPDPKTRRAYADTYAVYRSLYPTLREPFAALTRLAVEGQGDEPWGV